MKSKIFNPFTLLIIYFSCFPFWLAAQTKVSGQILPGKNYPLELWAYDLESNKYRLDQKLHLDKEGRFSFEISSEPQLYKLWLNGNGLVFINDGDLDINIQINMKAKANPFQIKGSLATQQLLEYSLIVNDLQQNLLYPLESKLKEAMQSANQKKIKLVEQEYSNNLGLFVDSLDRLISGYGPSLAVFSIIRTLDFNKYLDPIKKWHQTFLKERPNSPFTHKLQQLIRGAKDLQIGQSAPEIELTRIYDGTLQSLSAFKGQIVLLDFWASWCLPCRKENVEFKKIYKKYAQKGFQIWGISLDKNASAWKKAIKKDQLPWILSLSQNGEAEQVYKVVSLPSNFLIDQGGKILAKNLSGEELDVWFKKKIK